MLWLPRLYPVIFSKPKAAVSYLGHTEDASNATIYTYTSAPLATNGYNLVACDANGNPSARTLSTVTIDGIGATVFTTINASNLGLAFALAPSSGNPTGNIVATWSGACSRAGFGVWGLSGLLSTIPFDQQSSSASNSVNVNVRANGIAIGAAVADSGSPPTYTWTQLTERYDASEEPNTTHSGADAAFSAVQSALSVDCGATGSASGRAISVITFR